MKEYKILAKVEFNNKTFLIIIKDNKIMFAVNNNGNISVELTAEEYELMKSLLDYLRIDENKSILVSKKKVNDNNYDIYYDPHNSYYYWKNVNGSTLEVSEDNVILNFRYNHMPSVIPYQEHNSYNNDRENNKYYSRKIKIKKIRMTIYIVASISLFALWSSMTIQLAVDYFNKQTITEVSNEVYETPPPEIVMEEDNNYQEVEQRYYNFDEIKAVISENPNIDNETKSFLYNLGFVFDEYQQYMDMDLVMDRLKTLKIYYNTDMFSTTYNASGLYNSNENFIEIYGYEKFDINDYNLLERLLHEFFHVLQYYSNRYVKELSNQLFTEEVLRRLIDDGIIDSTFLNEIGGFRTGYYEHLFLYKYLASIIPQEDLIKYQFECSDNIIMYALTKIDDSISINDTLVDILDPSDELREDYSFEYQKKLVEQLNKYYKLKNGISRDEDLIACLDHIPFSSNGSEPLGKILFQEVGLDFGEYNSKVSANNIHALGQTYFSDAHKNDFIITFNVSTVGDTHIDIPTNQYFTVDVTPELCEKYKIEVQREKTEEQGEKTLNSHVSNKK